MANIKRFFRNSPLAYKLYIFLKFGLRSDEAKIKRAFKKQFGYELDLDKPETLNEKMQWLKLHDRRDINTLCADKYRAREFWQQYGPEHLIPVLYHTEDIDSIGPETVREFPCILKCNNGSGYWEILRSPEQVDWAALRDKCRIWKARAGAYYLTKQEWQYKNIKPCFFVEKLLTEEDGALPNDYKLHFINGELAFTYCSVDREKGNYRVCYDKDWNKLPFVWVPAESLRADLNDVEIPAPVNYGEMKRIGAEVAKNWDYVRVDFFECRGKLYFGEITLYHGSGCDVFEPAEYDRIYGQQLKLSNR